MPVDMPSENQQQANATFIHLRLHSDFSMVDGLPKIGPICEAVAEHDMPAVALTDQMNMCGLVRFYRTAHKQGLKPIVGVDLWVLDNTDEPAFRLTALAMNNDGYQQLTQLISRAYLRGHVKGKPCIDKAWLADHSNGVLLLSGGLQGDIGSLLVQQKTAEAEAALAFYQQHFPDRFYLELSRTGRPQEEDQLHAAVALAAATDTPVVATNEVVFLHREDYAAHEIRVAIHDGYTLDDRRRPKLYSEQQYLRSPAEMQSLFEDIPEALANTVEIAKRCNVTVRLDEYFLPEFPTGGMTPGDFLVKKSQEGLEERLQHLFPDATERQQNRAEYDERLQIELDVINQMGFPGYFLIVMEFIQWSKDNGIPVGPGRGSGARFVSCICVKNHRFGSIGTGLALRAIPESGTGVDA